MLSHLRGVPLWALQTGQVRAAIQGRVNAPYFFFKMNKKSFLFRQNGVESHTIGVFFKGFLVLNGVGTLCSFFFFSKFKRLLLKKHNNYLSQDHVDVRTALSNITFHVRGPNNTKASFITYYVLHINSGDKIYHLIRYTCK